MNEIEMLQEMISKAGNIVFFGGAGVSTESGIPDFRSVDGLYNQTYRYPPETILSHEFFINNTEEFYHFYRNKMLYLQAKPNDAHQKLAELEKQQLLSAVITQNIDGLHQLAGSKRVLELHGSVHRNYCMRCHQFYPVNMIEESQGVPKCSCGGTIKPDVVLYGEGLDSDVMNQSVAAISNADVLIIGGTSLGVYPAAGLIDYYRGRNLVLVNKSSTPMDSRANLVINDSIGKVFKQLKWSKK
ncbi:NAD-dependent protein deacylase [Acetobacterium wieringae]|jgi:NAD-dependent deacetylase|uniref:NAD-dependent protein deacylase n=1 Tax=Acetobacterium wieringae TaxID=52694 RepID=UPI000E946822|nr:NAD-dependent protein deacylase [Acetobacterium wieringae]MEA4806844.1 NAD-dependent protein deacylase [Acetobacterium wieringae]URN83678.1 NAD-dependent protein deacylase [Acetobacterium wieringae]HAZ06818.1 NAD-dependent protein deacylase [Acetobacterium sp.]